MIGATDFAAPHIVDAEVLGVIRRARSTSAGSIPPPPGRRSRIWCGGPPIATTTDGSWPRHGSYGRTSGRGCLLLALTEALGGTLLTTDRQLTRADGPRCTIELP